MVGVGGKEGEIHTFAVLSVVNFELNVAFQAEQENKHYECIPADHVATIQW